MKVGVTGHQRLVDEAQWRWVEEMINLELDAAAAPLVAVTSLAVGADQLLAKCVVARGGQVHAVLPFRDIERTFAVEDLVPFRQLLASASVEVLTFEGSDEDAYLAAGKRVVALSDLMLAIWDGLPARGKGGTGDVVQWAIARVPTVHINPVNRTVKRYDNHAPIESALSSD